VCLSFIFCWSLYIMSCYLWLLITSLLSYPQTLLTNIGVQNKFNSRWYTYRLSVSRWEPLVEQKPLTLRSTSVHFHFVFSVKWLVEYCLSFFGHSVVHFFNCLFYSWWFPFDIFKLVRWYMQRMENEIKIRISKYTFHHQYFSFNWTFKQIQFKCLNGFFLFLCFLN